MATGGVVRAAEHHEKSLDTKTDKIEFRVVNDGRKALSHTSIDSEIAGILKSSPWGPCLIPCDTRRVLPDT